MDSPSLAVAIWLDWPASKSLWSRRATGMHSRLNIDSTFNGIPVSRRTWQADSKTARTFRRKTERLGPVERSRPQSQLFAVMNSAASQPPTLAPNPTGTLYGHSNSRITLINRLTETPVGLSHQESIECPPGVPLPIEACSS